MGEFFAFTDVEHTFNPYTDHAEDLFHKSIAHTKSAWEHTEHGLHVAQEQRAIGLDSEVGIRLSSQDTLPDDILIYIFVLIAQDFGPVTFSIRLRHTRKREIPPQLVLSHVCSRWRMLALHTLELWNNICIVNPDDSRIRRPYHKWLLLAGSYPFKLSLRFHDPSPATVTQDISSEDDTIARIIQDIVSPLEIKMLHLDLTFLQLNSLSSLDNTILPYVENLEIAFRQRHIDETFSKTPTNFTRVRSVTLSDSWMDSDILFKVSLPWSQLQCLRLGFSIGNLLPLIYTLRQMSLLKDLQLQLSVYDLDPIGLKELVMPCLRRFQLHLMGYLEHVEMILRYFTFPALVRLEIMTPSWTDEIYETIKQHYNGRGLEEFSFAIDTFPFASNEFFFASGAPPVLVSSILKDMPKLRALRLRQNIMDDDAIAGLANGSLGRHLRELTIYFDCYFDQLLSMVETRKGTVDKLIESGCSRREMISVLKNVEIFGDDREWYRRGYKERVDALKKAGIMVKLPRAYVRW